MPEQVKRKRTSVKFTESEMKEIEEVWPFAKRHGATDKMNMLREGILRYVRELKQRMQATESGTVLHREEKPAPAVTQPAEQPFPSMADVERAIMRRYRQGESLEEIAHSLQYPLGMVESIVERLK